MNARCFVGQDMVSFGQLPKKASDVGTRRTPVLLSGVQDRANQGAMATSHRCMTTAVHGPSYGNAWQQCAIQRGLA